MTDNPAQVADEAIEMITQAGDITTASNAAANAMTELLLARPSTPVLNLDRVIEARRVAAAYREAQRRHFPDLFDGEER